MIVPDIGTIPNCKPAISAESALLLQRGQALWALISPPAGQEYGIRTGSTRMVSCMEAMIFPTWLCKAR